MNEPHPDLSFLEDDLPSGLEANRAFAERENQPLAFEIAEIIEENYGLKDEEAA